MGGNPDYRKNDGDVMRKMRASSHGPGRLLGRDAISERAGRGEIFDPATFSESSLRGAAYDLHIARDFLITPDGRTFGPNQPNREFRGKSFVMKPGEIAFVATREKLRLPWDIAANIAPKFDMMRRGIFVLHGPLVDPGYGMEAGSDVPKEDERLHFVITNLGPEQCSIRVDEERIAALQFFEIEKVPKRYQTNTPGAIAAWEEAVGNPAVLQSGLAFFYNTTTSTAALERRVEHIDTTNERVVAFGVYVLAAALLTIAMTVLVALLDGSHRVAKINVAVNGPFHWYTYVFLVLVVTLVVVLGSCVNLFARDVHR
jgi:deoxycytidine triphosphate deaminase